MKNNTNRIKYPYKKTDRFTEQQWHRLKKLQKKFSLYCRCSGNEAVRICVDTMFYQVFKDEEKDSL